MTSRLRKAMKSKDCLIGPGVFDGISAQVATKQDFDFLYLTGAGASGSYCGQPDLSVVTASEFASLARMICHVSTVPVIADADTGFGGPVNIARTISMYEAAGVAGCHIEDQTFPKRCGQLEGKHVVALDEFLERIRSAYEARSNPDFVIIARTDARRDGGFDEGVKRLKAAFDAGADVAFMESPETEEECRRLVKELAPRPVMINVLPHGLTPDLTTKQCAEMGFKMAIYPCTGFIPAMLAMEEAYKGLKEKGSDLDYCKGRRIYDFFDMMGYQLDKEFDAAIVKFAKEEIHKKYQSDEKKQDYEQNKQSK